MRKPTMAAAMALCAVCALSTFGMAGCSSSSSNSNSSATASPVSSSQASSTSSASSASSDIEETQGTGPLDIAVTFITDEGITSLDYAGMQEAGNQIEYGMTLAQVRDIMGAQGTMLTDAAYDANTYAFCTADKQETFLVVFDGSDDASVVVSCTTTVE